MEVNRLDYSLEGWNRGQIEKGQFQVGHLFAGTVAVIAALGFALLVGHLQSIGILHLGATTSSSQIAVSATVGLTAAMVGIGAIALHYFWNYTEKLERSDVELFREGDQRFGAQLQQRANRINHELTAEARETPLSRVNADHQRYQDRFSTLMQYYPDEEQLAIENALVVKSPVHTATVDEYLKSIDKWGDCKANYLVGLVALSILFAIATPIVMAANPGHLSHVLNVSVTLSCAAGSIMIMTIASVVAYTIQANKKWEGTHPKHLWDALLKDVSAQERYHLRECHLATATRKEWRSIFAYIQERTATPEDKVKVLQEIHLATDPVYYNLLRANKEHLNSDFYAFAMSVRNI